MTRPGGIRSTTSSTRSANSVGSPTMPTLHATARTDPADEQHRGHQRPGEAEQRRNADPAAEDDQALRMTLDLHRLHGAVVEPARAPRRGVLVTAQPGRFVQRPGGVRLAEADLLVV